MSRVVHVLLVFVDVRLRMYDCAFQPMSVISIPVKAAPAFGYRHCVTTSHEATVHVSRKEQHGSKTLEQLATCSRTRPCYRQGRTSCRALPPGTRSPHRSLQPL